MWLHIFSNSCLSRMEFVIWTTASTDLDNRREVNSWHIMEALGHQHFVLSRNPNWEKLLGIDLFPFHQTTGYKLVSYYNLTCIFLFNNDFESLHKLITLICVCDSVKCRFITYVHYVHNLCGIACAFLIIFTPSFCILDIISLSVVFCEYSLPFCNLSFLILKGILFWWTTF